MKAKIQLGGLLVVAAALSSCASTGNPQAKAGPADKAVAAAVQQPSAQKDALGNYRFLMQDGDKKMSADEFDAWMKANGIRVAKGAPASRTAAAPAPTVTAQAAPAARKPAAKRN